MGKNWVSRFLLASLVILLDGICLSAWLGWLPVVASATLAPGAGLVLINELDTDTPGTDAYGFIELFDGGAGNTPLNGLALVFYNGANDLSYRAIDLDGYQTDERGYFVIGNPLVLGVGLTFPASSLQNGPDAVVLYTGDASSFPNDTPVSLAGLVDAVVYGPSSQVDTGLLPLLNPGQLQVDENARLSDLDSLQRCPDGGLGGRNTAAYRTYLPTPGMPNCSPVIYKQAPGLVSAGARFTYTVVVGNIFPTPLTNLVITDSLPVGVDFAGARDGGVFTNGEVRWEVASLPAATLANPLQAQVQLRFAVTATLAGGPEITNALFAVRAGNFITPTFGAPLRTLYFGAYTAIHAIQGVGHRSPLTGQRVRDVFGVVTAIRSDGFYMQETQPDADPATSEALFVNLSSPAALALGDELLVDGLVEEYRPGGASGGDNLSITRLVYPILRKLSALNALPLPVVIGPNGRMPPGEVIEDDATGDVETSGVFDPATDGIDFYESLEGMLVQVNNPVSAGPTDASTGEIPLLADQGAGASVLTPRGGIAVRAGDFNPERLFVDDVFLPNEPQVRAGTVFNGALVGVIDYSRYNYKLLNLTPFPPPSGGVISETTTLQRGLNEITIVAFNLENLDPGDPQAKFDRLAGEIVNHLLAPDLIAVEEVQDNSGTVNDGVVAADLTIGELVATIQAAGGPLYTYRSIDPVNNQDGGDPGGNIRQGFLFRLDRGLSFIDRPGAMATTPNAVIMEGGGIRLAYSPGRIEPGNSAFTGSRKPLAGEFTFNGLRFFVIAVHLNSKQGDDPLFSRLQPPTFSSEARRNQQAQVVNTFVDALLAGDPTAKIVVLGDFNDYAFSTALQTLTGSPAVLTNLVASLPTGEQYTYVYEGNSQAIDHILVSSGMAAFGLPGIDIVHMNAEFLDLERPTDHDPVLARFLLPELMNKAFLPMLSK